MRVTVVPYNPEWPQAYGTEAQAFRRALGKGAITLHHIGSTAIPGILAKPIIDLLGVVADLAAFDAFEGRVTALGYQAMGEFGITGRRYFRKTNSAGQRTHHLHVFAQGAPEIERHLAFRDYMCGNPLKSDEYSALKARIAADPAISWDCYMDAKDPFLKATEAEAVLWYRLNAGSRQEE